MGWAGRIVAIMAMALAPGAALACGADTDCVLGDRTYRIALPDGDGPFGAIVFMHGYRGTAAGIMVNPSFRAMANDLGVALIAPQSGGEDWLIRHSPHRGLTDDELEFSYFDALLDDVLARFPIDPDRMLAAGFSAGGMMTWTLACHRGDRFKGFLPVSGTFWAPIPTECPSAPVDLIHIHGMTDTVVPIDGRPIADTNQGNVFDALGLFAEAGGFGASEPVLKPPPALTCSESTNQGGRRIALCLHEGGHAVEADWIRFGYDALVGAP